MRTRELYGYVYAESRLVCFLKQLNIYKILLKIGFQMEELIKHVFL